MWNIILGEVNKLVNLCLCLVVNNLKSLCYILL